VLVVGEGCGSRKYVGVGSLEGAPIVLWGEWFSAPLEYATPAAISISAARVSFRVLICPRFI